MGFRYIGTKSRILPMVLERIGEIVGPNAHVADLMTGTASVAAALRESGYRVTSNDLMTYSYHHARVALLFTEEPNFKDASEFLNTCFPQDHRSLLPLTRYEKMLIALSSLPEERGYFSREFASGGSPANGSRPRNYFSPENASKIDAVRRAIQTLRRERRISSLEHSLLLHDLIMAANDSANIAGTYGHYLSKTVERAFQPIQLRPTRLLLLPDRGKHTVLQGYAEEVAPEICCDLCYIDPPYMKRQYAANYHLLETIAREDEPEARGLSGLRPWRDQYSNFCTKTKIRESFAKIFAGLESSHFLISYSEDGLLTLPQLEGICSDFGKVETRRFKHKRFKSNRGGQGAELTEFLVHLHVA